MLEIVTLIREIVNQIMGLFVQFHRSEEADFDSIETQAWSVDRSSDTGGHNKSSWNRLCR
ncbi:hypothetical protein ACFL6S_24475 [Candidatus Poribacteria bacterium]